MLKTLRLILLFALMALTAQDVEAAAVAAVTRAQTSQDANGHIQFEFNGVPSVKIAPVGTLVTETCLPEDGVSKAGSLRYSSKNKVMEYCDGANWLRMGGSYPVCAAGQTVTFDASGNPVCFDPTCPTGQMLVKDGTGGFACANIMANMTCVQKMQTVSTQTNSVACPADYFVVAGTCWREQKSGIGTWDSGFMVGEWLGTGRDEPDRTHFTCRMETKASGAINVHAVVTCCK